MENREIQPLIKRLKSLVGALRLSDRQFALSVGISPSRLSQILMGSNPGADVLMKIVEAVRNLNAEWLLRGKGEMFLEPVLKHSSIKGLIPLVTQKAAAGFIGNYTDPEYMESLPTIQVPGIVSAGVGFEVQGDSMEPEVFQKDILACVQLADLQSVKDNRTYVVVSLSHGIVIKRVKNRIREAKELLLSSRNSLYKPFTIKAQDVLSVWRIVKIISSYREVPPYEEKLFAIEKLLQQVRDGI